MRSVGGRLGRVHRQRTDVAREAIGIFRAELCEAVIGDAGEFRRRTGRRQRIERRQAERENLGVVVKLVHHLKAGIEIVDGAHALHAFTDIPRAARGARHSLEQARRKEMAERVDVAHGSRYSAASVCNPAYSLSLKHCSAGSTSRANSLMFFSVRSPGREANCSSARKF